MRWRTVRRVMAAAFVGLVVPGAAGGDERVTGAEVLATGGLLDGRPATSHWLSLIGLRQNYPAVRWNRPSI